MTTMTLQVLDCDCFDVTSKRCTGAYINFLVFFDDNDCPSIGCEVLMLTQSVNFSVKFVMLNIIFSSKFCFYKDVIYEVLAAW